MARQRWRRRTMLDRLLLRGAAEPGPPEPAGVLDPSGLRGDGNDAIELSRDGVDWREYPIVSE